MLPIRATATLSGRGMNRSSTSASGRSTEVTTSARNSETAMSWNRPSTLKMPQTTIPTRMSRHA